MYRAITHSVINAFSDYSEQEVSQLASSLDVQVRYTDGEMHIIVDGEDVTSYLRDSEVNKHVSFVASYGEVRKKLVEIQRDFAVSMNEKGFGVVVDGRDIGTVVFPGADVKIFLNASPEVRAQRRFDELVGRGKEAQFDEILKGVNERDSIDSTRAISPLRKADDAILIDTGSLSFEDQVSLVINIVKERQIEHDV